MPTHRPTFREALAAEQPLVTPLAHDALSARLIERAGFKAFAVGGSAMLAARHAYPDIGLIGLTDMAAGIRDIAASNALPFFADGDDGYGDVKNVARMVAAYEAIGVGAVLIEDQDRDRKQQRADKAAAVVDIAVIEQKLKAALATRSSKDILIAGRTDAYGALGLDEALRRAERFVEARRRRRLRRRPAHRERLRARRPHAERRPVPVGGDVRRIGHALARAEGPRRDGVHARCRSPSR